jgi:hypothetical protein
MRAWKACTTCVGPCGWGMGGLGGDGGGMWLDKFSEPSAGSCSVGWLFLRFSDWRIERKRPLFLVGESGALVGEACCFCCCCCCCGDGSFC